MAQIKRLKPPKSIMIRHKLGDVSATLDFYNEFPRYYVATVEGTSNIATRRVFLLDDITWYFKES